MSPGAADGRARAGRFAWPTAWPWLERGRFSPLKATTLALLIMPAGWIGYGWREGLLGARPLDTALHQFGLLAVRLTLITLAVSPVRSSLAWPRVLVLRRMLGVAAASYAAGHLVLYAAQQNWHLLHVGAEILHRIYLTIGFAALLGLLVLAGTSTNACIRRLGRNWQRLHRLIYLIAALALLHFFMQAKADVRSAVFYTGLFCWLMLWRLVPAARRRQAWPLLALGLGATLLTAASEYGWYAVATRIDPMRLLRAELVLRYGPRPAVQIALLSLAAVGIVLLRQACLRPKATVVAPPARRRVAWAVAAIVLLAPTLYWAGWTYV